MGGTMSSDLDALVSRVERLDKGPIIACVKNGNVLSTIPTVVMCAG
jgi:hypothetical protein